MSSQDAIYWLRKARVAVAQKGEGIKTLPEGGLYSNECTNWKYAIV